MFNGVAGKIVMGHMVMCFDFTGWQFTIATVFKGAVDEADISLNYSARFHR